MDIMNLINSAPVLTDIIAKFLNVLYNSINNFGWAVVVFTLIVKLALSPLDIWQKTSMRKQSKAMQRLQPELAKLQKEFASRPDILRVKQAELYKKNKISFFSSCLPTIVTIVVFIVIWNSFSAMVKFKNEMIVYELYQAYSNGATPQELASLYKPESWLWVKNVFMPDSWGNVIPNLDTFVGTGIGNLGAIMPEGAAGITDAYDTLTGPAASIYNKSRFWDIKNWNGFFVLPLLSIITTILSTKLMQSSQVTPPAASEKQAMTQKNTSRMMMIVMPITIAIFSLFYSAAFSLYLFVSNLISTIINLTYNIITKKIDKKEKELELSTTFRRIK